MLENMATSRLVLQARGSHSLTVPSPANLVLKQMGSRDILVHHPGVSGLSR